MAACHLFHVAVLGGGALPSSIVAAVIFLFFLK